MHRKNRFLITCVAGMFLFPAVALAGPPFLTDDPEPVEYQHVELDFYTAATHTKNTASGTAFGLDANYGLWPEVEATIIAPVAFSSSADSGTAYGYGDTQFAVKYRFIHQDDEGWQPEVAIYPTISAPIGNAGRSLGTGHTAEFMPVYLQKDVDPWQTYAGGGYWNNPGTGNKNFWFFGGVLQRKVMDNLELGGELFHQTASTVDGKDSSGFNLGGTYDLNQNYHILFTAGRGVQNTADTDQFSYYMALQLTY